MAWYASSRHTPRTAWHPRGPSHAVSGVGIQGSHAMTPPIWLDAADRRRPTRACWTCGREVATMRMRTEHLRPHGWLPGRTLHGRGLLAARADLGARPGSQSAAAVRPA
jgi:hypothetical protein